jgi:hypothetical protein
MNKFPFLKEKQKKNSFQPQQLGFNTFTANMKGDQFLSILKEFLSISCAVMKANAKCQKMQT